MHTIHAKMKGKQGGLVTIEIPTDVEIGKIAARMHRGRTECSETVLGWKALYRPSRVLAPPSAGVDPSSSVTCEVSKARHRFIPSVFILGYGAPWKITLSWQDGDDQPPTWMREEGNLICKAPQPMPHLLR